MVKKFIKDILNIEKSILDVMYKGFNFCFGISICSIIILVFYILNPISYIMFESGIILFKASLIFSVFLFICAVFTNKMK